MPPISLMTAAGHRLIVDPKKERSLFRDLLDALVAEGRLSDRQFKYERYRSARGLSVAGRTDMRVTKSAMNHLDSLDDKTFGALDRGIQSLAENPQDEKWHLAHLRWFLGDLRLALIEEFPVFFTTSKSGDYLFILHLGIRRWAGPVRESSTS